VSKRDDLALLAVILRNARHELVVTRAEDDAGFCDGLAALDVVIRSLEALSGNPIALPVVPLVDALERTFDDCTHIYASSADAEWCNLCGARRFVSSSSPGPWFKPHWRDLLLRFLGFDPAPYTPPTLTDLGETRAGVLKEGPK
jgi:hypothetical protein